MLGVDFRDLKFLKNNAYISGVICVVFEAGPFIERKLTGNCIRYGALKQPKKKDFNLLCIHVFIFMRI